MIELENHLFALKGNQGNREIERIHANLGKVIFQRIILKERSEHFIGQFRVRGDLMHIQMGKRGK
jgi:hypothetical protein